MSLLDLLKFCFPVPRMPQKRYLIIIICLTYLGIKIWAAYTYNPDEGDMVDRLKNAVMIVVDDQYEDD